MINKGGIFFFLSITSIYWGPRYFSNEKVWAAVLRCNWTQILCDWPIH